MTIGLIHGGTSTERAASTMNAEYIEAALSRLGYKTRMLAYDWSLMRTLEAEPIDFVFLCVQGKGHGDGTCQALLDYMGIPYTGSPAAAAALINDKIHCKEIFAYHGIQTPAWQTMTRRDYIDKHFDVTALPYPFVAKAPTQGGSFGIALVKNPGEVEKMEDAFLYDDPILLESFAPGRFATVGVLEDSTVYRPLPCVESVGSRGVKSELTLFTNDFDVAASNLPAPLQEKLQREAVRVCEALGARDYARVDFIVSDDLSRIDALEINAVPGLKPRSLLPRAAEIAGIAYDDLIGQVLQNAMRRYALV